jgi:type IV pilus assembly protein PilA
MPNSRSINKAQRGFTMIELIVVIGIIALLAILATPYARSMIIDGKVPTTATDVTKTITKLRNNFANQGTTPYTSITTAGFANIARGLVSALNVSGSGTGATVTHDIGSTGATVAVAAGTITTAGDSFTVTMNNVNEAACPSLASQLSKSSEVIMINGTAVKAVGGTYQGGTAGGACTTGDGNTFVFTFR